MLRDAGLTDPGIVVDARTAGLSDVAADAMGIAVERVIFRLGDSDLPFAPMFHGIDERVPVDALTFGVKVLRRLVATS